MAPMSDIATTVAALKPGMRVRATFRRTDQEDYAVEGTLTGTSAGSLNIGCNYVRYGHGAANIASYLVAVEVLTPEFEAGAWYEHPDEPGRLWRRYNTSFYDPFSVASRDDDSAAYGWHAWRAGLRRVTLPSEQQEQP